MAKKKITRAERNRLYYQKNKTVIRKQQKNYHAQWYIENREEKLAANKLTFKRWLKKKGVKHNRKRSLDWRNRNIKRARANAANWYAKSENSVAHHNRRRARKLKAKGSHTAADILAILKKQKYRCVYCDADLHKVTRHVDHITPLVRGGSNDKSNLQVLCRPCNSRKGTMLHKEFLRKLGKTI